MEFSGTGFIASLAAIIVIDLVLAGDNAIVIALAARNLPPRLRRQAIIWGTLGAIALRSSLTLIVVWLLDIPGLLFAGGVMLIWIACKLLVPENRNAGEDKTNSTGTFWGAIRTIVIADMAMGLDNVLAVAGAAHGSFLLVITGLLISVPIVVLGSTLLLRLVDRFPAIVYLGAGVLALTAARMIAAEPYLEGPLSAYTLTVPALYLVTLTSVLWVGFVSNHRALDSKILVRLAGQARQRGDPAPAAHDGNGGNAVRNILVPIDNSRNLRPIVAHVKREFLNNPSLQVHLLNVQPLFSWHVARFIGKKSRDEFHRDLSERALRAARSALDDGGIPYRVHTDTGDKARRIAETARRLRCDHIVMSTARKNSLTRMLEDSTTSKVLELTTVPVTVIAGDAVSNFERYGILAGIAAVLAILVYAAAS